MHGTTIDQGIFKRDPIMHDGLQDGCSDALQGFPRFGDLALATPCCVENDCCGLSGGSDDDQSGNHRVEVEGGGATWDENSVGALHG